MIATIRGSPSAGPDERRRCAADADADRQGILQGPGPDALTGQRGAMPVGPGDLGCRAEAQQQVELLGEQRVVVSQVQPEQREGLGERASPHDQVDPTLRDQVEGGELLEDAHRIVGTEHRHRAVEPDGAGPGRGRREQNGGGGVHVLRPVVLTDAVGVQADLVGALDLLQQVLHPLEGGHVDAGLGIGHRRDEAVDADVHGVLLSCARQAGGSDRCIRKEGAKRRRSSWRWTLDGRL
jgi:hypothetical protein